MNDLNPNFIGTLDIQSNVKILLLYPVPPPGDEEGPFISNERRHFLPNTLIYEMYIKGAPSAYDGSESDTAHAVPLVVGKVKWAEAQGYDAVVIGCMVDPGVGEAKQVVGIPVVGIGEANRALAALIGKNPAYIMPDGIPVERLAADEEVTFSKLVKLSRWLIEKRGTDVLIPNCSYIGGLAHRLQSQTGVPVLPNVEVGLKMAELLAVLNVKPERVWVASTRAPRYIQILSRVAWQLRRFVRWI